MDTQASQRIADRIFHLWRPRSLGYMWLTAILIYLLLVPTGVLESDISIVLNDIAWTIAAALALLSSIRAARLVHGRYRLAWQLFAWACTAWLISQFFWNTQELLRSNYVSRPSLADVGYLGFAPLMIAGLLVLRTTQSERRLTWLRIANLALVLCSLALLLVSSLTQPFRQVANPLGETLILLLEGSMIGAAFVLALYVLWSYNWNGRLPAVALITVSLGLHTISGLFYTHAAALEIYSASSVVNVGWLLAFGAHQLAAESQISQLKEADADRIQGIQAKHGWVEALVPGLLVVFIALSRVALSEPLRTDSIGTWASGLLAVFGIVLAIREGLLYRQGAQFQERLRQTNAELARSYEQLRALDKQRLELQRDIELTARAGAVGLWDVNLRTGTIRYSPQWKRQLGYENDELPDTIDVWRSRVHPDDLERLRSAVLAYLRDPSGEFVSEERLRHRDGSYRWILVQASALLSGDGKPERLLGSHVDITERKNIELSLRESEARYRELTNSLEARVAERTQELTEAYRESKSFAYAVAHDLKAPLRAIDGFSHLLEQSVRARLNQIELGYIARVRHGAIHMALLIDGLLAYSQLEHRQLRITALDCRALIDRELESMQAMIRAADAELVVTVPPTKVLVDEEGLRIVIRNLIDNALKFASPERKPRIEIGAEIEAQQLVLSIRDNGIGFDPQYRERIFEIFHRLHSSGYGGTGIGLALVRKAVQRMQGRIWAHSQLGAGATFYVSLPRTNE